MISPIVADSCGKVALPETHPDTPKTIEYDHSLSGGTAQGPQESPWEKVTMGFGRIDKQRSGRWRARYLDPMQPYKEKGRRNYIAAPATFATKTQARAWLAGVQADLARGEWKSPEEEAAARSRTITFKDYSQAWMEGRELKPSTRRSYESLLDVHLLPEWSDTPLNGITTAAVRSWLPRLAPGSPGARKRAYDLFKTIVGTAEEDDLLAQSPFKKNMLLRTSTAAADRGGKGKARPYAKHRPRSLSMEELRAVAAAMPDYLQLMTVLCGLTGLRVGEVRELRRRDLVRSKSGDVKLMVARAVTGQGKGLAVDSPKTVRSVRDVYVPPPLDVALWSANSKKKPDELLFSSRRQPGEWIPETTFRDNLGRAGERVGVGKISPHDLRRTAVSLAQQHGASLIEIQDMVGHATPSMTMRYSMSADREKAQKALARRLGDVYESQKHNDGEK